MTKENAVDTYYDDIKDALAECTENAMRSHGRVKYTIYCWEEDGVQVLEDVAGGNSYLISEKDPDQQLFLITTVDVGVNFDPSAELVEESDELVYEDDEEEDFDYVDMRTDDEMIDELLSRIDWDEKMAEIQDEIYYEER